jgi:hypothetical protein
MFPAGEKSDKGTASGQCGPFAVFPRGIRESVAGAAARTGHAFPAEQAASLLFHKKMVDKINQMIYSTYS